MTEFSIDNSLTSSGIDPGLFIDENTVRTADESGSAVVSQYKFDSASLNTVNFINHDNLRISEAIDSPQLVLQYCISGTLNFTGMEGGVDRISDGECLISVLNGQNTVCFNREQENSIVSILIPIESSSLPMDESLVDGLIITSRNCNKSIRSSPILPRERIILSEILNPALTGNLKKIFIESKMLELTVIRLSQLQEREKNLPDSHIVNFRKDELDRIRFAGELLAERMETPPTISSLARISGINEFKLKTGFKTVFGSTVYGYLRDIRMERAYSLIIDSGMNVSEAAFRVGYSKPGHFSKLFRARYGISPGQLKKWNI